MTPADPARREVGGRVFRDLNGNGMLDPFEDPEQPVAVRVDDLVGRLSLAEKAGLMFQAIAVAAPSGNIADEDPASGRSGAHHIGRLINHVNVHRLPEPRLAARWSNQLQAQALAVSPHGIPVTISSDPRHSQWHNAGASIAADWFSVWPEPIGLAALADPEVVRSFARIAREEYTAVGIRAALHPTIDLATEPRWARQYGTFGQDPELTATLALAYLDGFEGDELGATSVACMAKHFPGGGPQQDGEDPHFPYGREQVYPGGRFDDHLAPFRAVIERGVSGMMPYYGMPIGLVLDGEPVAEVGFGFNRQIIQGLLRDRLGYDGVVCTDWGLLTDSEHLGRRLPARAWGVEHLSTAERALRVLDAGCDQFGGEQCPELIVHLVEQGLVSVERIDTSVRRLLEVKFRLGLFDDPFVSEDTAAAVVGSAEALRAGHRAQAASMTVLSAPEDGPAALPLAPGLRVHAPGVSAAALASAGLQPAEPETADLALIRLDGPYEPRDTYMLEAAFRAGTLEFDDATVDRVRTLAAQLPVVLVLQLDRPAVLGELDDLAAAVTVVYGASDAAVLDALTGAIPPRGRLPFDLPRSAAAVAAHHPDIPGFEDALYTCGTGRAPASEYPVGAWQ